MELKSRPGDYIINMSYEAHGKVESNFLLHGLNIKNDTDQPLVLKHVNLELYSANTFVKQISYCDKALSHAVERFAKECTWLGEGFGAQLFLGEEGFWNPKAYSSTTTLMPNQETGLFNEYFVVVYQERVDLLEICVIYEMDGKEYKQELTIPLINYKNKNEYIFPLKGCFSTCGNYNCLLDHRQHYSMEFAIDMAQYNSELKLSFKENMNNEDYFIYGKDVLAIADGEVVDCYHAIPITTSWVWEERAPYFKQYGLAAQFGNYVVLQHANGESSFYGHMIKDSLTVKKGDRVKQGQMIGKVGHTGLSNCPHLHFQLMDKPDILTGRGLPCSFTNLKDVTGNPLDRITDDNIIVHTDTKWI